MSSKNIILVGAIAIGAYLLLQAKKIPFIMRAQKSAAQKTALRKAAAQKIGKKIGKKVAQKIVPKKIGQPTTQAARIAAARKAAASHIYPRTKTTPNPYRSSFPATGPRNIVHITPTRQKIAQKIAQRIAKKEVAPWKAPFVWSPKPKFRIITPSDILRNLAERDIARKKAEQQKTAQKTTPSIPSDRRKKRLKALYGSHWHDVWVRRQKRR